MKEFTATDAKDRWGEVLDAAQQGPVCIAKQKRPYAVVLSMERYQTLRQQSIERVKEKLDRAMAKGKKGNQEEAVKHFHEYLGMLMEDGEEACADLDIPGILALLNKKHLAKR